MTVSVAPFVPASEGSDLVVAIETARALFDAGDVKAALLLSMVAYDKARTGVSCARRVKASRELVDKARRLQAEALKIESLCSIAMANAVDEAQAAGALARPGRPRSETDGGAFTLADVGLSATQLHNARSIRSAVSKDPAFLDRVIDERLSADGDPSRGYLRSRVKEASRGETSSHLPPILLLSGQDLGKLHWYELEPLIREYRRDIARLEAVRNYCVPADDRCRVREVLGEGPLNQIAKGGGHG